MHDRYADQQAAYYAQAAGGHPYPPGYAFPAHPYMTPANVAGANNGYGDFADYAEDPSFMEHLQFGVIDNGLLVAMTLAGVSLDNELKKLTGARGYGPVLGATLGNALTDGVAAMPRGYKAAAGVVAGSLLPVLPVVGAALLGKKLEGTTKHVVLGTSVALLAAAFFHKQFREEEG